MNKKGFGGVQIITFIVVIIAVLITALLVSKITDSILDPFSEKISSISPDASESVDHIQSTFVAFWDYVIIIAFIINVIVLLMSSFFVDTHPVFIVMYIGTLFFTFLFTPEVMVTVDEMFLSGAFNQQLTQLPLTDFLRRNFQMIMLGITILSGVVMYVKFKIFGAGNQ